MTIVIGLETKECVVLAADSAVTHGQAVTWTTSSLGESSDTTRGIEEAALKIVRLGPHAAAAIAGNAHDATEALAWFRAHVQAPDFAAAWAAAMSSKTNMDFDLLVGRWHNSKPELYRCAGNLAERMRPGRPVVVGSARDDERQSIETRTRVLLVRGNRPHMIQLGICALLAWRAFNEVGFKDNIGGTPASILVNSEGTMWLPDTSIYAVDVRRDLGGRAAIHEMIHRLSVIGRDDIVAVASTFTNQTRLLVPPMRHEQVSEWFTRWGANVLKIANDNAVVLIALVGLVQRRLAVLELSLCQGRFIKIEPDQVTLGDELRAFFLKPPPTLPGGAVYSIPLGEPEAIVMLQQGGPVDAYDLDLCASYVLTACVMDQDFETAERVWEAMLSRFPCDTTVLTTGLVALELEPGTPRLDKAISAWESALIIDPSLVQAARQVAACHPDHPEIAERLLAAAEKAERE